MRARGWAALFWMGLALGASGATDPSVLTPGASVERTVSAGDAHEYTIALVRGQLLHAVVDQRGVDTVEELFDPRGNRVIRVDSARAAYGPEHLWAVAEATGTFRLRLTPLLRHARGAYRLRVEEVRPATPADRTKARAARIHASSRNFEELTTAAARERSLQDLAAAAALWAQAGDALQEALALLDIGRAHQFHGELRESIESLRRAQARAEVAGDTQLLAKIVGALGLDLSFLGDPAALATFERSAALAREAGDPQQESDALNGQAYSRWSGGAYQEALELNRRSLAIARSLDDRELQAWALWGLGLTDVSLGELERALDELGESLGLWRSLNNPSGESVTLQDLGFAYWLLGRGELALDTNRQALAVARKLGNQQGEALALNNIGLAETDLGDPASAVRTLEDSVAMFRRAGNRHGEAIALRNLGHALVRADRAAEGIACERESLAAARAGGDRAAEANALASLAQMEGRAGDLASARGDIASALVILESQRGGLAESRLRSSLLTARQDFYATALEILFGMEDRDPEGGHAAEAFGVSEQGRARALVDGIAEARLDLSRELPPEIRQREKDLGAELERRQRELRGAPDPERAERDLRQSEEEWERLIAEMRRRVPRYAALRFPAPISAADARALLDPETALVSYALSLDPPVAFLVTRSDLVAKRLPVSRNELLERVEDYVGLIAKDSAGRWDALGGRLYRELVAPWRSDLPPGIRRIVIVPDGVLQSLPFEALGSPGPEKRLLVEEFAVSYAPSATVLAELAASRGAPPEGSAVLALADPPIAAELLRSGTVEGERFDLSPLPDAAREAAAVARFGDGATELDVGRRASESRIKARPLEGFRVLHFATHALLSRRVPSRSALLLGPEGGHDGLLTAREIYRLRLHADLVALSGCQTARGRILAGEGVQSLAHAFFYAGARSVVASLWDVSDRRTAELMTGFYAHLAQGESKSLALQSAKVDLLRREPRLAPRYWAPFVLIGEPAGTVPLRKANDARTWAIAGGGGVLLVLWTFSRRRRRGVSGGR
jgi:CHAT domain-containing protein